MSLYDRNFIHNSESVRLIAKSLGRMTLQVVSVTKTKFNVSLFAPVAVYCVYFVQRCKQELVMNLRRCLCLYQNPCMSLKLLNLCYWSLLKCSSYDMQGQVDAFSETNLQ